MGKKNGAAPTAQQLIEENERVHGAEARERWGDEAVDAGNRRLLGLSPSEFDRFQSLGTQINTELEAAVRQELDPAGETGERICRLHREWLVFTWNFYSPEAHRGLADMYVADGRFTAYYDGNVAGCATWLRNAIHSWAK